MKRTRFWLFSALVLVSALLAGAVIQRNRDPLYQLSRYPQTPGLERYRRDIAKDKLATTPNKTMIQVDAPLQEDFKLLFIYRINKDATFELNPWSASHSSLNPGRTVQLNPQQFAEIKRLTEQLPPSQPPAERADLMIVTTESPSQIRLYHRKHPPTQLRAMLRIGMKAAEKELRLANPQRK